MDSSSGARSALKSSAFSGFWLASASVVCIAMSAAMRRAWSPTRGAHLRDELPQAAALRLVRVAGGELRASAVRSRGASP